MIDLRLAQTREYLLHRCDDVGVGRQARPEEQADRVAVRRVDLLAGKDLVGLDVVLGALDVHVEQPAAHDEDVRNGGDRVRRRFRLGQPVQHIGPVRRLAETHARALEQCPQRRRDRLPPRRPFCPEPPHQPFVEQQLGAGRAREVGEQGRERIGGRIARRRGRRGVHRHGGRHQGSAADQRSDKAPHEPRHFRPRRPDRALEEHEWQPDSRLFAFTARQTVKQVAVN